jgi:hypothetical protein
MGEKGKSEKANLENKLEFWNDGMLEFWKIESADLF